MRRFHQYTQFGTTLVILAGLTLLQGCSSVRDLYHELFVQESMGEFNAKGGMEKALDNLALQQVEEYKKTGKFSSTLKLELNVKCYQADSKVYPTGNVVTNLAAQTTCFRDGTLAGYASTLFVADDTPWRRPPVVEVRCVSDSYGVSSFKDKSFTPRLIRGRFPECPGDSTGKNVLPLYVDHSLPRQHLGLSDRQSILKELDAISDRQVEEFAKTGQYSSALSFNAECGAYASSISDDGRTVINWVIPTQNYCNGLKSEIGSEFVSAVFAVENKQKRTVTLSRVVCEVPGVHNRLLGSDDSVDIIQKPPHLVNGVPTCPTGTDVFTKQYPPVPMR
jgi:hypothetical protein